MTEVLKILLVGLAVTVAYTLLSVFGLLWFLNRKEKQNRSNINKRYYKPKQP